MFPDIQKTDNIKTIDLEESLIEIKKTNNSILKYIKTNLEINTKISNSLSNSKTPFKKSFIDSLQELNKNIKGFLIGTSEGKSKEKFNFLGFLKDVVGKGLDYIISHPELFLMLGVGIVADLIYNYIKTNGGKIWQAVKEKVSEEFKKVIQSLKDTITNIGKKYNELKSTVLDIIKSIGIEIKEEQPSNVPTNTPEKPVEDNKTPEATVPTNTPEKKSTSISNDKVYKSSLNNIKSFAFNKDYKNEDEKDMMDEFKKVLRAKPSISTKPKKGEKSNLFNKKFSSKTNNSTLNFKSNKPSNSLSNNNFIDVSKHYQNRSTAFYKDSVSYQNIIDRSYSINSQQSNNTILNVNMPVNNSVSVIKTNKQPYDFLRNG